MRNKTVHLLSLFLMLYIGVEVTIGGIFFIRQLTWLCRKSDYGKLGWIVTFLMTVREGGPSSGYVSTGFFGGKYLIILLFVSLC